MLRIQAAISVKWVNKWQLRQQHHTLWWWCLAAETCIFTVVTVVHTNTIMKAVYKSSLPAVANQVIQENWTSALAEWGISKCLCTCRVITT